MNRIDLTRWSRTRHADGSVTLTAPPRHPAFAPQRHASLRVRYDAPVTTLAAHADALAACTAGLQRTAIAGPVERLVTQAGEYGALGRYDVRVDGDPWIWAVGLIAGDDRMIVVDGLARSANIVALVRDVLVESLWAGAPDRIRLAPYAPPAAWFGVRRTWATCWLAPDAPRDPAVIVVGDAVPRGPAERTHALVWPLDVPASAVRSALDGTAAPTEVATWRAAGQTHALARMTDARWSVRIALQAGSDQQLVTLRDLVRTLALPPAPTAPAPSDLDLYRWMAT